MESTTAFSQGNSTPESVATTMASSNPDLGASGSTDPHLINSFKKSESYALQNSFNGNLEDVGQLRVHLIDARGLYGIEIGGKSDPFCSLTLGDLEFHSEVCRRTVDPVWKEQFIFGIRDITEVLNICVYDRERFQDPRFLGCVAIPLLDICAEKSKDSTSGEYVYALKDQKMKKRARGKHPRIKLKFDLNWNVPRACINTINPPVKKHHPSFKRSLLAANVQRMKKITTFVSNGNKFMNSCLNWENPTRSVAAFIGYELAVYTFQPYMLPMSMLAFMIFYPLFHSVNVNEWLDPYSVLDDSDDSDSDDKEGKMKKKSSSSTFKQIPEVAAFVQNTLGDMASSVERVKNVFIFAEPFMSFTAAVVLAVGTTVLYFVPLRIVLMAYGLRKFSKKLLNPDRPPSSKAKNFLSRVPDDPALEHSRPLSIMDDELLKKEAEKQASREKRPDVVMMNKFNEALARRLDSTSSKADVTESDGPSKVTGPLAGLMKTREEMRERIKEKTKDKSSLVDKDSETLPPMISKSSKEKASKTSLSLEYSAKKKERDMHSLQDTIQVDVSQTDGSVSEDNIPKPKSKEDLKEGKREKAQSKPLSSDYMSKTDDNPSPTDATNGVSEKEEQDSQQENIQVEIHQTNGSAASNTQLTGFAKTKEDIKEKLREKTKHRPHLFDREKKDKFTPKATAGEEEYDNTNQHEMTLTEVQENYEVAKEGWLSGWSKTKDEIKEKIKGKFDRESEHFTAIYRRHSKDKVSPNISTLEEEANSGQNLDIPVKAEESEAVNQVDAVQSESVWTEVKMFSSATSGIEDGENRDDDDYDLEPVRERSRSFRKLFSSRPSPPQLPKLPKPGKL